MNALTASLAGLGAGGLLAMIGWLRSRVRGDVSIVDSLWSWLVWSPAALSAALLPQPAPRGLLLLGLAGLWAARLSGHITRRHRGQPEDRRYQAIRARNQPHFEWKSLYLVFGLQALLGWLVAWPLMAALALDAPWQGLDGVGVALIVFGLGFEAVADAQLTRFKANPAQRGQVMDRGLWRYSRHPNYFGECCAWWGFGLVALAAGAWWGLLSPLLMTVLLLKVSGITLLEADIGERRPGYADYIRRTPAFLPGRPLP